MRGDGLSPARARKSRAAAGARYPCVVAWMDRAEALAMYPSRDDTLPAAPGPAAPKSRATAGPNPTTQPKDSAP